MAQFISGPAEHVVGYLSFIQSEMEELTLPSNAMTFTFMSDGIPIVYYGQEQYFSGAGDPVSFLSPFVSL